MTAEREKHVVLVSRIFLPESGAAPLRLAALTRSLLTRGFRVTVLTAREPRALRDSADRPQAEGLRIRTFPVLRDRAGYVRGYIQYMSFDLPVFWRVLTVRRPDAVVVEPPPTTGVIVRLACALRRVPYVYYAADIWSDAARSAGSPRAVVAAVRWMERFAMRRAAAVLCVSTEFATRLQQLGITERVTVIGNGADLSRFSPDGESAALDGPYFLYAGTASEVHGARVFVDAFARVVTENPDARLVFIGHGADWPLLHDLATTLPPGAVRFLPRAPAETAALWIRGAVATLASVAPEGYVNAFPTKMYASVACGTPVIFSGVGPGREFAAQDHVGVAVDHDPEAVAGAMRDALRAPDRQDERERRAEWARAYVSLEAVSNKAAEVVGDVVATRPR